MDVLLHLTELSSEPLHAQISRQIRAKVLAHELEGDEALPSIRALARGARVSVITVQRAYEDLEREGLLRSRPGKGFFVAAIEEERKQDMADRRFEEALAQAIAEGAAEGLSASRIREVFERLMTKPGEKRQKGGGR